MSPKPTTHIFKTIGSCQIKADVFRPTKNAGPAAAIVHIHGGALITGSRREFRLQHVDQYLQAGYAVVSIDYRLAPESKLPDIIEDLRDAFRWVHDTGSELMGIDPERLAAVGHSAGGYLALMAGFCVQPAPSAIVSFYGYGDIVGDWYSKPDPFYRTFSVISEEESGRGVIGPPCTEPYEGRGKEHFYLYCRQNGLWPQEVSGHDPAQEPAFFVPYCPLQNVSPDYPPTLLLHGDHDTDVPYEQSVLMAEAFSQQGVEHELITLTGLGHGFDQDTENPTVRAAIDRVMAFLNAHLRLAPGEVEA